MTGAAIGGAGRDTFALVTIHIVLRNHAAIGIKMLCDVAGLPAVAAQITGFDARDAHHLNCTIGIDYSEDMDKRLDGLLITLEGPAFILNKPRCSHPAAGRDHLWREPGDVGQEVISEHGHPLWSAVGHKIFGIVGIRDCTVVYVESV